MISLVLITTVNPVFKINFRFNQKGFDKDGFDKEGFNKEGFEMPCFFDFLK